MLRLWLNNSKICIIILSDDAVSMILITVNDTSEWIADHRFATERGTLFVYALLYKYDLFKIKRSVNFDSLV